MANTEASKIEEILETLNHAISIHTKAAVQNLPFNKSELVKITDVSNAANGEYKVWNGSVTYSAYSEKTDYEKGSQVYVTILNNDTSERKLIIGLYQDNNNSVVNYKNPLNGYLPLTNNILDEKFEASIYDKDGHLQYKETKGNKLNGYENEISLLANYNGVDGLGSKEIDIYQCSDLHLVDNYKHFAGYKYMGISGNFKVDFKPYNVIKGNYGIKVYLKTLIKDDVLRTATDKEFEYKLSVPEMLGSVYDTKTTYFPQGILIDTSNIAYIYDIKISVFQDGEFKINEYVNDKLKDMPYNFYNEHLDSYQLFNDNIFIKDISVQFGDDIPDTDNLIEIKSQNGLYYDSAQTDDLNKKNLYIEWTRLDKDTGKFKGVNNPRSELNEHFKIHWFKKSLYKPNEYIDLSTASNIDEIEATLDAYKKWEEDKSDETRIAQLVQSYNLTLGVDYFVVEANDKIQLTIAGQDKVRAANSAFQDALIQTKYVNLAGPLWEEIPPWKLDDVSCFELNNFLPDTKKNETVLKVMIEIGPLDDKTNDFLTKDSNYKILESKEFTLFNARDVSNALSDDIANALKITCLDNSKGKYFIYNDTNGEILNRNDISRIRQWGVTCISPTTGEDYLNGNEIILWKIPKNNTMIVFNQNMIHNGDFITEGDIIFNTINEPYDDDFYYVRRNTDNVIGVFVADESNDTFQNELWTVLDGEVELIEEEITPVEGSENYLLKYTNDRLVIDDNFYQSIDYSLERYYIKSKTNNIITCFVIKNNTIFKNSLKLEFGQYSTAGSDYLFTIGLGTKIKKENGKWISVGPIQSALTLNDNEYCEIVFELYNSKNEKIDLTSEQKNDIIKLWVDKENSENEVSIDGYYSGLNLVNNNTVGNAKNLEFTVIENGDYYDRVAVKALSENITDVSGIILQAELTQNINNNNISFKQYLPIHIKANKNLEFDGTDYIIYDDKSANPFCFNDTYKLNGNEDYEFQIFVDNELNDTNNFYPKIEKNKIIPNPIYVDNLSKNIYIIASKGEDEDKEIYYSFPLLIIKNKYNIPAYNQWTNNVPINNSGDEIATAMLAVGHQDTKDNQICYTGFVMGDVSIDSQNVAGLFAYNKGTQTFGLDTEGELVLGAEGEGQITMNGSSGLIQSAANIGHENSSGVKIDLANSRIDVYGIDRDNETNLSHISLNSKSSNNSENNPYFLVTDKGGKNLIYIDDNSYYLQSANYSENNAGTKINLQNGEFFTSNGTFTGEVTATSGTIGGWTINADGLSTEDGNAKILITSRAIMGGDATFANNQYSVNNGWYIAADGTAYIPTVLTSNTEVQTSNGTTHLSEFISDVSLSNYGITQNESKTNLNISRNIILAEGKTLGNNSITDIFQTINNIKTQIGTPEAGDTTSIIDKLNDLEARVQALEDIINDSENGISAILDRLTDLENNL